MTNSKMLRLAVLAIVSQLAAVPSSFAAKHLEPLPVTGSAEKPVIILEAEPLDGKEVAVSAVSLYGGKVLYHDGESCNANDSSVIVAKNGHAATKITFSYTLDPKPKPGTYIVWTALQTGSTGAQSFTIKAGESPDKLVDRLAFNQTIEASWKTAWRKADGALTILPTDSTLMIEVSGPTTQAKVLDAFLLVPEELVPVVKHMSVDDILRVQPAKDDIFKPYLGEVPKITETLSEEVKDGVKITRLRYQSVEGSKTGAVVPSEIYAIIGRPEKDDGGKHPAILICHGGGGAAIELNVIGWAQLGFVALSMDLPGHMGEKEIKSVTRVKSQKYGSDIFVMKPAPRCGTIFDTIVAGLKGFNLLASQADVDEKRIGVTGISWGGYTSLMLASLLGDRLAAGFSLYGSGFYPLSDPGIGSAVGKLPADEQMVWMQNFDPGPRAKNIKAPFLMYPAANDIYFLPPAVMATYDRIGGSKYICFGPNQSHWINLPGGTVSWTGPTFTDMEPAFFLHMLAGNKPPLPQLKIVSKDKERPAFAIEHLPADGVSFWACYSTNDNAPWPKREWIKVAVVKGEDGIFRPSLPDGIARCDWYGGVSFTLAAGALKRPMSLSTVIERFEVK
ncbi:MAG: acetylxylan esterase [Victivallales bacterium]